MEALTKTEIGPRDWGCDKVDYVFVWVNVNFRTLVLEHFKCRKMEDGGAEGDLNSGVQF